MKNFLKRASALIAILTAAPVATQVTAQAEEGWYGRVDAGWTFDGELDGDQLPAVAPIVLGFTTVGNPAIQTQDLDDGWAAFGGLGYGFANGVRLEGELGYRDNDLKTGPDLTDGDVKAWSLMANAFYDFNRAGRFQPYVGLGVGAARVSVDAENLTGAAAHQISRIDDSDTGFAYQGLAGVGVKVTPRLTLDVGYRYFAAPDLEFDATLGNLSTTKYEADYMAQTVTAGLRWQFAAPAAPVVAPPPPAAEAPPPVACPTDAFKVYFEWDRSALNQAALETIDAAASRAQACGIASVSVEGHADTSGSKEYNVPLSMRRAVVVRDALAARGVPADIITAQGFGETQLDKATKDGVREPLNRRAAVTITFR